MNFTFRWREIILLTAFWSSLSFAAEQTIPNFAQPPSDARILKIIHSWPDKSEAQDQLIGKLREQGFGGVVCNVSFEQYLESEAKWQAFTRAVNETKKAGLAMWLYDERGYPSGNAGGLTLRDHPEWEARGLLINDTESEGGAVTLDLPPGQLFLAAAFPVHDGNIDLAARTNLSSHVREGKLQWQAPAGRWRVMAITENRLYEGSHAEVNLHAHIPYLNLLQPEPTARFLELTHQAYAKHLGNDLGKYFLGTFTDEPSLMSFYFKAMPYRPLPWASNLPVEFKKRRGYTLDASNIPALVADASSPGQKIRYDYWQTVGELVSENFFGQIQTWCRAHNIPSGGHLLLEESIAAHPALYGDFFRCIRRLDAPSIDCLSSLPPEVPWHVARLLASAAELEGRNLVMCETSDHTQRYRPPGDQRPRRTVTEAEIRGTCNKLIVSGVNNITSYYSFADLADDQLRRLNEWIGRACAMLRGGRRVADIAVLYPTESLWAGYAPSRHWSREAAGPTRIDTLFHSVSESLFASRRDFTYVDSRALAEAKVESGSLVHGQLRWRILVLPGTDTLPLAAWKNLAQFVRSGGVLISLGALPANSESEFPSPQVLALANEIFGSGAREVRTHSNAAGGAGVFLPGGSESLLPLALNSILERDVNVAPAKSPVRITHRHIRDRELYFVINDSAKPWSGQIAFAANGNGERLDLATGQIGEKLATNVVQLTLEPYGASLFRFAAAQLPKKRAITGGALPNLSLHALPQVEPSTPHGEFVRAEMLPNAAGSNVWRATGTITKSQVDTHLFVQFHYPQPLDLSQAECLSIETGVPPGQKTSSQILVILHEQNGGDFIASTGRSLASAGRERSILAWSQFKLAGWSKDADGELDLKQISDIRIGWGGYLGREGEQVQFSVAAPQTGSWAAKGN